MFNSLRQTFDEHGLTLLAPVLLLGWAGAVVATLILSRRDLQSMIVIGLVTAFIWAVPFMRPFRRAFALVAMFLLGGIGALEIGLRLSHFGADGIAHFSHYGPFDDLKELGIVRLLPNPTLGYGMTPNQRVRYMGQQLDTNSQGYRDHEFRAERTLSVPRIVAVGSSITLGGGVDLADSYPKVLERLLTKKRGAPVEVMNCGVLAYPTAMRFGLAAELGRSYHPDIQIIELASFEIDTADPQALVAAIGIDQPSLPTSLVHRFSFAITALYPPADARQRIASLLPARFFPAKRPSQPVPPAPTDFLQQQLTSLGAAARQEGYRVVLLFNRPMRNFSDVHLEEAGRAKIRSAAEKAGITVVDTFPLFLPREFSDDFIVFPGDLHPNARAHARYADALTRAIKLP